MRYENPTTGQVIELIDGKWVADPSTMPAKPERYENPDTGEVVALKGNEWQSEAAQLSAGERFLQGAMDPIHGLSQLASRALPDSWSKGINEFNNYLVEQGFPLAEIPEGGIDQQVVDMQQEYSRRTKDVGFDMARLGGNLVSALPMMAIAPSSAPSILGRVAQGVGAGIAGGLSQPVTESLAGDEFLRAKAGQAATGALLGGAVPLATGAAARLISPKASVNPDVQAMKDMGVKMTPGQVLGPKIKEFESNLANIPFSGQSISAAQQRAVDGFNEGMYRKVLSNIDATLPNSARAGQAGMTNVREQISQAYDELLPNLSGIADRKFLDDLNQLQTSLTLGSTPKIIQKAGNRIIQKDMMDLFRGGLITGETAKKIESRLGDLERGYRKSTNVFKSNDLANFIGDAKGLLRDMLARNNPDYPQLPKINRAYAELGMLEHAAAKAASKDSVFTPQQLRASIGARTKNIGQLARGEGLLQDVTGQAERTVGAVASGRGPMSGATALGGIGGLINPLALARLVGTAGVYGSPLTQAGVVAATSARPAMAPALANMARESAIPLAAIAGMRQPELDKAPGL